MSDVWHLPGPSRWLAAAVSDRDQGRSGVMVCPSAEEPDGLVDGFVSRLPRGVDHHDLDAAGIEVEGLGSSVGGVIATGVVAERFGFGCGSDPAHFALHPDLGRVLLIVDARRENNEVQAAWSAFAAAVAENARSLPRTTRPTVWVVVCPEGGTAPELPAADVCFVQRWWWGALGPIDAMVASADNGLTADAAAMVGEIARWDLGLLADLVGWSGTEESLTKFIPLVDASITTPPPDLAGPRPHDELIERWSRRLVESWDGIVAAHVGLEAAYDEAAPRLRMWAGQVARLFPFVELERSRLARWLAEQVRLTGGAVEGWDTDEIGALEIGPLWACIRAHRRVTISKQRTELLRDLRDARNSVAHRTPVALATMASLRAKAVADRSR